MPALSSIVDSHYVKALVCVADGNLFPSDLPARRARARVVNDFLASFGVRARYDDRTLPAVASAASFRAAALALAASHGIPMAPELTGACLAAPVAVAAGSGPIAAGSAPVAVAPAPVAVAAVPGLAPIGAAGAPTGGERLLDAGTLGRWSELEEVAVADYLACCLRPDRTVLDAVGRLAVDYRIGAIGLCGPSRLDACLTASRLERAVPAEHRLCSEPGDDDDASDGPAREAYELACERLGLCPEDVVAVAHTPDGVLGARAAGIRTIGNLHYVTARHRGARAVELARAGAVVVVRNWSTIARLMRCLPLPA